MSSTNGSSPENASAVEERPLSSTPAPITDEPHVQAELAGAMPVLDLRPERGFGHVVHALRDIGGGMRLLRLGWTLGWLDICQRYRGSLLGPFWLTLSTAILVSAMGVLYATLFHIDLAVYLPFLCFSLVLWSFLAGTVTEGCATFTNASGLIHAMRMPFFVHVERSVVRNVLTFLHSVGVIVILFLIFHVHPTLDWQLPVGMGLWLLDLFAITLLMGVLGARFRDMPPIASNVMQILFFITPVLWKPDLITLGRQYLLLDPCYPLIEVLRGPFMGSAVRPSIWWTAIAYSVALWSIAFGLFARMRSRLAYWV
ncbi:ABC transporter permease [Acetobacter estunensis]